MQANNCRPRRIALIAGVLLVAAAGSAPAALIARGDAFLSLAVTAVRNVTAVPTDPTSAVVVASRTQVFENITSATGAGATASTEVALEPAPSTEGGGLLSIDAMASAFVPLRGEAVASIANDGELLFSNSSFTDSFEVDVLVQLSVALTVSGGAMDVGESVALVELAIWSELMQDYLLSDAYLAISPGLPGGSLGDSFTHTLTLGPLAADTWGVVVDALSYAAPLPGSAALLGAGLLGLGLARCAGAARRGERAIV